jgi:hypothetical protein
VSQYLERVEDVTGEMGGRSSADAAAWFADWLRRRDASSADLANEQLAGSLESLAEEFRGEARRESTPRTRGLLLAATVLVDAAGGLRVGDLLPVA